MDAAAAAAEQKNADFFFLKKMSVAKKLNVYLQLDSKCIFSEVLQNLILFCTIMVKQMSGVASRVIK
jgi:hypothetical protein